MYLRRGKTRVKRNTDETTQQALDYCLSMIDANYTPFTMIVDINDHGVIDGSQWLCDFTPFEDWVHLFVSSMTVSLSNDYLEYKEELIDEVGVETDANVFRDYLGAYEETFFRWLAHYAPELLKFHITYSELYGVVHVENSNLFYFVFGITDYYDPTRLKSQTFNINFTSDVPNMFISNTGATVNTIETLAKRLMVAEEMIDYRSMR